MAFLRPVRRRGSGAWLALAILAMVFALVAGACSSSGSKSSGSSTTLPPEAIKVPMSEVRAQLPKLTDLGNQAAAAAEQGDFAKASTEAHELHEVWEHVEGRVKAVDPDAYIAFEDAQAKIANGVESKVAADVKSGAADQASQVQQFLDKHPA